MYAVIKTGGKQHKVIEGETLRVEKIDAEVGSEITLDKVMMVKTEENLMIGKPYLESATVTAEVMEQGKDKKVIVFKYRRKKNYKRMKGHRQQFTAIRIKAIAA